jgi:hypothetical protein
LRNKWLSATVILLKFVGSQAIQTKNRMFGILFERFFMRIFTGFLLFILLGTGMNRLAAQNVVLAGAAAGNGSYATLGAAFTAINGSVQTGLNITISIVGNTTETGATLNAGTWASVLIQPSGGVARVINGNFLGNMITLNGADNVTIDGLNTGGNSLRITNVNPGVSASTIRFIESAQNNTVTNCIIQGSSTGSTSSSAGATIIFATASSGTGNDNNVISNNDIGPAGANLPYQVIKSVGTAARENSGNTIDNNLIYNYFSASNVSAAKGVLVYSNSTGWTISNNRVYQTATRTATTSGTNLLSCIEVLAGSGYSITGNILGFANAAGTGFTTMNGGGSNIASHIQPIVISQTGTLVASTISNNIISGFDLSSSRATSTVGENIFAGIHLVQGPASITGNTIGDMSSTGAILIKSTAIGSTAPMPAVGINLRGTGSVTVQNNNIGGMSLSFISPGTGGNDKHALIGILNLNTGVSPAVTVTIDGNTIGGTVANSMTNSHTSGNLIGINNTQANCQVSIINNTIRNLTHTGANTGTDHNASVIGISEKIGGGNVGSFIRDNLIHNLSNSFTSTVNQIHVKGILLHPLGISSGITYVERNWIHSLSLSTTATSSSIIGINPILNGTAYLFNNMISLGEGQNANRSIFGIRQQGMACIVYHNSIRILGNVASGGDYTACYSYTGTTVAFQSRNNIFSNERTGSGAHYSLHTFSIPASYQASHNVHYSGGTILAVYNSSGRSNLAALFAGSGQDNPLTSKQVLVTFTSTTDLHTSDLQVRNEGLSPTTPAVAVDFDQMTRPSCVDIGCDEFDVGTVAGNTFTWLGTVNNDWCTACNWDREAVPADTNDVVIKDDCPAYPLLNAVCGSVAVNHFTMQGNVLPAKSSSIDLATYTLSVTGDVSITGTCSCTGSSDLTALTTGLIELTGTTQSQSVDIRRADGTLPGVICKLRVNKTEPTGVASVNHEAYLRNNLIVVYNFDLANGVLLSKTAGTYDADEMTAANYKTITIQSDEPGAVTRQSIAAQDTRNGFFQGRLNRRIRAGATANEYLFPLGFRMTGASGILNDYFYTPALIYFHSVTNSQYLAATYLHDQNNPTADGVSIGFTGHGCLNAFEIDDQGGATASTCNDKEIDILSTFYWDFQESGGYVSGSGDPLTSPGALGAVDYDLECAGDVFNLQAQDGLTGSELRLLQRPSVTIPGNTGQGAFVTTEGSHNGTDLSANSGIALYSIATGNLQGARRDGLTVFGGFASAGNGPSPLPVELLYFNALPFEENKVICRWETATEINNDRFEVEAAREKNGYLEFSMIGTVNGSGTSSQKHIYSFVDERPVAGANYYRLRQVDYDGTAKYSSIVVVKLRPARKFEIVTTSPNPFLTRPVIFVQTENDGRLNLQLENSIGQVVYSSEISLPEGGSSFELDVPTQISSGVYFLRATFDEEQQVSRLVKQ